MPSPIPLFYDTYYHIFNRGTNRENIFLEERNYAYFLKLYAKYIEPVAETFAFCLLRNHFHLLVRIKTELEIKEFLNDSQVLVNIHDSYPSQRFSNLFNAYAKAINKTYGRTGSLFQHPFGRVPVTDPTQFERVIVYIHQNPQKHRFVEDFRDWKYSSYNALLSENSTRLQRQSVLAWFGGRQDFSHIHQKLIGESECAWFAADDVD